MTPLDSLKRGNINKPELMAPVGSIETFWAAVEAGADAVYLGLKGWNARASASNFTLKEYEDLLRWAQDKNISIHLALNSSIAATEVKELVRILSFLSALSHMKSFGGVIIQDLGILFLINKHFPHIKIHLSTLAGIHSLQGVKVASRWGVKRVVLAREVPLEEAVYIAQNTSVEVEIFIHGALCFSFSGLCLASSFRGGRSGLRGECAQPCRLNFKQGKKEGFFLSCTDFSGLSFVPAIKRSPIKALKIEGRMKSPFYVSNVVKAYRLVLDATDSREEQEKIQEAEAILKTTPSRKCSHGFWVQNPSSDVLAPHRSGTSGIWVATVITQNTTGIVVKVRSPFRKNSLLRPETQRGQEEPIIVADHILSTEGAEIEEGKAGEQLVLKEVANLPAGTKLFFVGALGENPKMLWRKIRSASKKADHHFIESSVKEDTLWSRLIDRRSNLKKDENQLIIKVASCGNLAHAFNSPARWVILKATMLNLEKLARMNIIQAQKKRLVLSLPSPMMGWTKRFEIYRKGVEWFVSRGFLLWEVNNLGHMELFRGIKEQERLMIIAGSRLNVRNRGAMAHWSQEGLAATVLTPEMTKSELVELMREPVPLIPFVTVFAWPPLMISCLEPSIQEGKPFFTGKGEAYFYRRSENMTFIYGDKPISWFEKLGELRDMGFRYFVVDISEGPRDLSKDLSRLLSGYKRGRDDEPYSLFNWSLSLEKDRKTGGFKNERLRNSRIQSSRQ